MCGRFNLSKRLPLCVSSLFRRMFSGLDFRRQTHEQESQGEKAQPAISAHGNRSRARMSPAVCDKLRAYSLRTGGLRSYGNMKRGCRLRRESSALHLDFGVTSRRAKEVRSVRSAREELQCAM